MQSEVSVRLADDQEFRFDLTSAEPMAHEAGRRWLDEGTLEPEDTARLVEAITRLRSMYESHIALEDEFVFPLAGRTLDDETLLSVGREMAERRGIPVDAPEGFSRCAERRQ